MNFCDVDSYMDSYYKLKPKETESNRGGKGDYYCPLCDIRVKNKQRHFTEALHRSKVLKDTVYTNYGLKEYIIHFDKYCNEKTVKTLEKEEDEIEDSYWSAAKEDLGKEDYKKLKEYVNGRGKNIGNYSRHSGLRRFSRTSKGKQTNGKKISRRKSYSRI